MINDAVVTDIVKSAFRWHSSIWAGLRFSGPN